MSTVQPVRKALRTLWSSTLPTFEVKLGRRVVFSGNQRLSIGSAAGSSGPVTLGPNRQMEETYLIACVLSVSLSGSVDSQEAADDAVQAAFDAAELALRSIPGENAGVTGVMLAMVRDDFSWSEGEIADTGGTVNSALDFNVAVRARYRLGP